MCDGKRKFLLHRRPIVSHLALGCFAEFWGLRCWFRVKGVKRNSFRKRHVLATWITMIHRMFLFIHCSLRPQLKRGSLYESQYSTSIVKGRHKSRFIHSLIKSKYERMYSWKARSDFQCIRSDCYRKTQNICSTILSSLVIDRRTTNSRNEEFVKS